MKSRVSAGIRWTYLGGCSLKGLNICLLLSEIGGHDLNLSFEFGAFPGELLLLLF